MDPFSQGVLGGIVARTVASKAHARVALICGVVGGLAPDLDVFIRSSGDPLLGIEYHRHFTHSLSFIPLGGLLVALALYLLFRLLRRPSPFKMIYIYSTLGYATHGLLDACTGYGTHLLWPFSNDRLSWDIMSIVNPVFTLSLLLFVVLSASQSSRMLARVGLGVALLYLAGGAYQHSQAKKELFALADERGHVIEHYRVMPTLDNIIIWRGIYRYNGKIYTSGIYTLPIGMNLVQPGEVVDLVDVEADFPTLGERQRQDVERFRFFADGFVALHPERKDTIMDARYATEPYGVRSIWGIKLWPALPDKHVDWVSFRGERSTYSERFQKFAAKGGCENLIEVC